MENFEENGLIIPNLGELIEPHMISEKSRITSTNYSRLTNFEEKQSESTLLKIEVKLINTTTGEDWMLSLIAKIPPKSIKDKDLHRIQKEFKNEVGIYMSAKPAMEQFLRIKGIRNGADFFATSFGGRINLRGDDIVDQDAVLILQNYNILGFTSVPRRKGFDLESSKLLLKALAKFHGTFFGLKAHNPQEFNEKVKPYLSSSSMMESVEKITRGQMLQTLKEKGFPPEVMERALATFNRKSDKEAREPWAIFTHNNTWVDNIMLRLDKHGKPKYVKLLNFAVSEYTSPLRDLLFFLFSSVELGILKTCLDDLIDCYYYSLISILKRIDVNNKHLFCRLEFNKELKLAASQSAFYKILCKLNFIYTRPLDINCDNVRDDIPELQDALHKSRLCYIVNEFESREWLYV